MARFLSFILFNGLLILSFSGQAGRPAESGYQPAPAMEQVTDNISAETESAMPAAPPVTITESAPPHPAPMTEERGHIVTMDEKTQVPVLILDFPARGMSMDKVINEMGQPVNKFPAIGKPPITRWDYPDRTVFFEYSSVIHVVAK